MTESTAEPIVNAPAFSLLFAAGKLHLDVQAARVLRRLLDDRPDIGAHRRGGPAVPVAERSRIREGGHSRGQQGRPGSQPAGIDRR